MTFRMQTKIQKKKGGQEGDGKETAVLRKMPQQ